MISIRLPAIVRPVVARHSSRRPTGLVQVLEHVPASVKIVRHVERRMICRECDTTVAGEMPTLPIELGKPGPGLVAHIMIAKFDDHIPLYRLPSHPGAICRDGGWG